MPVVIWSMSLTRCRHRGSPSQPRNGAQPRVRACVRVGRADSVLSRVKPRRKGCSSVNALHVHLSSLMDDVRQCLLRLRQNRYCHIGVTLGLPVPDSCSIISTSWLAPVQRGHRTCGDVHSCRDGGWHSGGFHAEWGYCITVVERRPQTFFRPLST